MATTESARRPGQILVEIAAGELIDKITILEIKKERIKDEEKLRNIAVELEALRIVQAQALSGNDEADRLAKELKEVNEALWCIEDKIRDKERDKDFGPAFIELARSVYLTNDRRASLKRRINDLFGSRLVEEKSYASYQEDK